MAPSPCRSQAGASVDTTPTAVSDPTGQVRLHTAATGRRSHGCAASRGLRSSTGQFPRKTAFPATGGSTLHSQGCRSPRQEGSPVLPTLPLEEKDHLVEL